MSGPNEPGAREHRITVRRSARFLTLGGADGADAPSDVWLALHGYGQLAAGFLASLAPLAAPGRLLVAPEALSRFYHGTAAGAAHGTAHPGASWMTREDREAEIADYVRYLDDVAAWIAGVADLERATLRVLGFSQGAATAMRWAVLGTRRVDHLILWGGAPPEDLAPAAVRARLGGARTTLVLGERDRVVPPAAVERGAEALARLGLAPEVVRLPGGHAIDAQALAALATIGAAQNGKPSRSSDSPAAT